MPRKIPNTAIIDYDEKYATATAAVAASASVPTRTTILTLQVKPGKQAWLQFLGNAVQAGGDTFMTFRLLVNRSPYYPFDGSLNQWAPPESNFDLPVAYELPTSCEVQIVVDNSDASNTYTGTGRIRIVYTDFVIDPAYLPQ